MKKISLLPALFFLIVISHGAKAQEITAQTIMEKLKERFERVHDYSVTLDITPNIERFNTKEMKLRLFYKQPDKVHIESKGFVMIPRQLFESNPAQLLSKFDPILTDTKKNGDTTIYMLRLISKPEKNHQMMENYVTVDGNRWVILKLQAIPAEGRSIDIIFEYTTVDDKYLLPSVLTASFNFGSDQDPVMKMKGFKGMPTKGTVEIRYSDYVVNAGLDDKIFEKEEKQKK